MPTSLAKNFRHLPSMKVEKMGCSAGLEDLKIPHLIKIFIWEKVKEKSYLSCEGQNIK